MRCRRSAPISGRLTTRPSHPEMQPTGPLPGQNARHLHRPDFRSLFWKTRTQLCRVFEIPTERSDDRKPHTGPRQCHDRFLTVKGRMVVFQTSKECARSNCRKQPRQRTKVLGSISYQTGHVGGSHPLHAAGFGSERQRPVPGHAAPVLAHAVIQRRHPIIVGQTDILAHRFGTPP